MSDDPEGGTEAGKGAVAVAGAAAAAKAGAKAAGGERAGARGKGDQTTVVRQVVRRLLFAEVVSGRLRQT